MVGRKLELQLSEAAKKKAKDSKETKIYLNKSSDPRQRFYQEWETETDFRSLEKKATEVDESLV